MLTRTRGEDRLRLKSIVSLIEAEPSVDLLEFCHHENITHFRFEVNNDKEKLALRPQVVIQVLQVLMNPVNHPVYVHCNDGTSATGIVFMILRKLQKWNLAALLSEFGRYARVGYCLRWLLRWLLCEAVIDYCGLTGDMMVVGHRLRACVRGWDRFTRAGEISRHETLFAETFKGEISIPYNIPHWLWRGMKVRSLSSCNYFSAVG